MEFSNTRISLGRSIVSYGKVQYAISAIIRNKPIFARRKPPGSYLDVGCGPNIDAAFCNLDYMWRPGVDVCWDVTRGLPFPDKYFGGIFTEHMLEHITFQEAVRLLGEFRRVLRDGAVLRIVVPDGELYLSRYASKQAGHPVEMPNAGDIHGKFPFETPMIDVNFVFREHGHQFIWDFSTLKLALLSCGFKQVEKRAYGDGADSMLIRDTASRRGESLYVEAS